MSTANENKMLDEEFVSRFVEMCGSNDARTISEYFGISYQGVKNYLSGRRPDARVLVKLAERSPVSIHWLLTGEGAKYVDRRGKTEAEMAVSLLSEMIEPATLIKIIAAFSEERVKSALTKSAVVPEKPIPKTVTLSRDRILKERPKEAERKETKDSEYAKSRSSS